MILPSWNESTRYTEDREPQTVSALPLPRITPEEYLELDRAAEEKSEYFQGEMYAMAGGTLRHSAIALECALALTHRARPRGCTVIAGNVRVRGGNREPFFYPDLFVICGEPQLADDKQDTVLNPMLVLEVLSPTTEDFDRGRKFEAYAKIPSLREYVLVAQAEPRVTVYTRQPEDKWLLAAFAGLDAKLRLESLDCDIPLADLYGTVTF
jgi:Uma2 family endonuclease